MVDLTTRRRIGSEMKMEGFQLPTEEDEANLLKNQDIDDMASHRMDRRHSRRSSRISNSGMSQHPSMVRVGRKKRASQGATTSFALSPPADGKRFAISATTSHGEDTDAENRILEKMYGTQPDLKEYDHTPHAIFVQMNELDYENMNWNEQARWIKYEESKEEGSERWGRPHLSSLSFHSLINLRLNLERGIILLDFEARDFTNIAFKVAEEFYLLGFINEEAKPEFLRLLLLRHNFVDAIHVPALRKISEIRRSLSRASIGVSNTKANLLNKGSMIESRK